MINQATVKNISITVHFLIVEFEIKRSTRKVKLAFRVKKLYKKQETDQMMRFVGDNFLQQPSLAEMFLSLCPTSGGHQYNCYTRLTLSAFE